MRRSDGTGRDHGGFDQTKRIVFKKEAVGERSWVALVCIDHQMFHGTSVRRYCLPFATGRKSSSTAPA